MISLTPLNNKFRKKIRFDLATHTPKNCERNCFPFPNCKVPFAIPEGRIPLDLKNFSTVVGYQTPVKKIGNLSFSKKFLGVGLDEPQGPDKCFFTCLSIY